jgi:PAS domain S-box-containing protein
VLQTQTAPTGVERRFGDDEIIVTKTDLQGRIVYANDVFLRVSALTEAEALGQPHSLIRHPRMPRAVFRLLWQSLQQREELFAYVCNLASDGAHYWVLAHVTPSLGPGGAPVGYHSSRRSPDRSALAAVEPLYERLLAEESRHTNARAAAEAGMQLLLDEASAVAGSYDAFIWGLQSEGSAA